jgi:hypothetical protein
MTVVERIRTLLIADISLAALVGARIYPQYIPQGSTLPAVVLTAVSDVPYTSFTGSSTTDLRSVRLQVDSYATRYLDAHAVADAVDAVIANLASSDLQANRESMGDLYEDETQLHRVTADYFVAL